MKRFFIASGIALLFAACATATPKAEAASSKSAASAAPVEITAAQFKTAIADYTSPDWKYLGDKPAIVDFYATWCGPCKQIAPILKDLAKEYDGQIVIYKVDVDKEPELASAFGVQSIPTLLFIPMGKLPMMQQGAMPKEALVEVITTELLGK